MTSDNTSPGALAEFQVSQNFVNNVNIVAVHSKDWAAYKYSQLDITYNGKTGRFVVMDYCADTDCGGCCTANANAYGYNFLTDIDSSAAQRVFGISNAENALNARATFALLGKVDPNALVRQYP